MTTLQYQGTVTMFELQHLWIDVSGRLHGPESSFSSINRAAGTASGCLVSMPALDSNIRTMYTTPNRPILNIMGK
jgi:hypothetical protein